MENTIDKVYRQLKDELANNSAGRITFTLADVSIIVKQPNVVGNIIEEWLSSWLTERGYAHIYNHGQCSPDFWMNTEDLNKDWMEVKSFTGGANFDIANFMSYITDLQTKPWKLDSKYLCIKYTMDEATGIVNIDDVWLNHVWEMSCPSKSWAIKVQDKKNVIYNLRPASWYSQRPLYRTFESKEHFLSALDYVIKTYPPTSTLGMKWRSKIAKAYSEYSGSKLNIPLWQDIAREYDWEAR